VTRELVQVKHENSTLEAFNLDLKNKLDQLNIACHGLKDRLVQCSTSLAEEKVKNVMNK
jgi:hypothetical protein